MPEEPYLITSLIRKLTELLHEHGDLPVYVFDYEYYELSLKQANQVEIEEQVLGVPKRVAIYSG